jgi:hypothetical protein
MAEPITREKLLALAAKGAFRARLKDGHRVVVTTPKDDKVLLDDTVVLFTAGEEMVITSLDQIEAAEAVWPDVIELVPDDGDSKGGPA